jgi:hypothetical protein
MLTLLFVENGRFPFANFEDPNHNIDLPVFSIHGNHDDPSREGARQVVRCLCCLQVILPSLKVVVVRPAVAGSHRRAVHGKPHQLLWQV